MEQFIIYEGRRKWQATRILCPVQRLRPGSSRWKRAGEAGVSLTNGYNGDLTSVPGRFVGGQMVNMITTVRTFSFKRRNRRNDGHSETFTYKERITVCGANITNQ